MNAAVKFLKLHRWTFFVFIIILFRPQIMGTIRNEIIRPMTAKKFVCPRIQTPVRFAALTTGSEDDGCGDDGSCEEEDNEYYDTPDSDDSGCNDDGSCESESSSDDSEDYSDDSGCNDDGSCDSDGETYEDNGVYYSDDGCDCSGGTVVSSDPGQPAYTGIIYFNFTINFGTTVSLYITDADGRVLTYIIPANTPMEANLYRYSWNGAYGNNATLTTGTYYATLETTSPRRIVKRQFTYTTSGGFGADTIDF